MSASVATPFPPSCKLNGAFLEAHPKAGTGGLLSRRAMQIQCLDYTGTGAHPISRSGGCKSARIVFPGFSESSDHQGTWAEKEADLHLLALSFQLPEALSVSSACKFLSALHRP